MSATSTDVVIVGGGIAGITTAYFLGKAGVKCVVVERDSVGSHASGFAYGGLGALGGPGVPGPAFPIVAEGMRLHREFSNSLPDETGINMEYRDRPSLSLAFTDDEVRELSSELPWKQEQEGYVVRLLDAHEARSIEPRISPDVLGAVYVEGGCDVEPYRLVLALTQASESLGVVIRSGRVTGLKSVKGRIHGVLLGDEEIACDCVVLAMGPWAGEASTWLGIPIKVRPLKGQILRLRAPGRPFHCSLGWNGNYAASKPDGLLWAGTTEEEAGFDEQPTSEGRDEIMLSLLKMAPSLEDAELVQQTACLRPISADTLMLVGRAPDREGVYVATGGGRQGIVLGPALGRITADLITAGVTPFDIGTFDPGRFAG